MANGGNRSIAPVRKLIAAVLGTVATFVVLFGLGMTSWSIVALGVALVALAIALATFRTGGRAWVIGVGHVHSASEPPTTYSFGRCELQLVIDAPGLPPRSKKIIEPRVPVAKWPSIGQTLPIRVALDDQRRVRVLWDEVPTHAETAATMADLPPEYAGADPLDEVLIQQDAPPWAEHGLDDDYRDAPGTDPLLDDVDGLPDDREAVVVHQRPGGPVVLEGTLVESTAPLPRRATPAPRPPVEDAPPMTYGDPYAGPPDDPYAGRPRSPYRDPYDEPPGDPDLDPPASPYRDPYGEVSGTPDAGPPTAPYRDPYDEPLAVPDADRSASAPHHPYDEPAPEPVASPEPTGSSDADEPTERVMFIESTRPAGHASSAEPATPTEPDGPAGQPSSAAQATPAAQGTWADKGTPAGASVDTPVVPVRQRIDEPIVDPVDVPLDAPDDEPVADDLDEAIFGYDAGTGTTPISGVGITVLVTDLDRSLAFYRNILGFTEVDRGPGNAVLASGSTRLVLREVSEAAPISRRLVHVNLEVDDIQAAYERLRESGVRFTYAPRVVNRGAKLDVWAAAFRDPDGHGIALTQWRTRADA
ncbi:VOC family protein [Micromonospora inyonensis]|uniref:Glyoxalase-like domain-containing protein n=1 Tax=Micromonospora inyonensis TaxID=47866 RepID=A0A1C6RXX6_9ACTN|nr:Glyoxalase-like domain-containing protein [Micromonospora inyonensis]